MRTFMSREVITFAILTIVTIAVGMIISLRMGLVERMALPEALSTLAFSSLVMLFMALFWGAASAGVAALWASLRKKQANTVAALNVGLILFLIVQILGVVAYENLFAERPSMISATEAPAPESHLPVKEIK
jgi:hypothetical protein